MLTRIFKFFIYLLIFTIALVAFAAVIAHIALIMGIIFGSVFSPILYLKLEKLLNIQFPEFTKLHITEMLGALYAGQTEYNKKLEEMKQKRNKIDQLVKDLQMDIQSIRHEFELMKQRKTKTLSNKNRGESERMQKAMEQLLGNPRWVKRLNNIDEKIFFENMKM